MKSYECIVIISPDAGDGAPKEGMKKCARVIESGAGEITRADNWGRRRLAYEIKKHREGDYLFFQFRSDHKVVTELDRQLRLDEGVLRHMIVRNQIAAGNEPKIEVEEIQAAEKSEKEEG